MTRRPAMSLFTRFCWSVTVVGVVTLVAVLAGWLA